MSLTRSASGPGGLSINTSSANTFGSNTSQPPAAGGLFGSAAPAQTSQPSSTPSLFGSAAPAKPSGGLFGGASTTATTQPQQTGSLFGGAAASQPAAATTGGGLFGSAATTQQPQQTGGGLFGQASTATSQPQQTGGLFGQAAPAAAPAQQSGGLFGSAAAAQPQPAKSLFGQPAAAAQPQQTTSMFGNTGPTQPQPQQTGFGQTTQNATAGGGFGGSLFSNQQNQAQAGAFGGLKSSINAPTSGLIPGGLTMGQQNSTAQSQVVPGVRIDLSNLRGTTRYNDLQEDLQKEIANIDRIIQQCINQHHELAAFMPGHGEMVENIPNDVKFVERKYDGVRAALESDAEAINQVRGMVNQDADHARLSFRAIDNLKLPQAYHALGASSGLWSARQSNSDTANADGDGQDLVGFFSKTASDMDEQLARNQRTMSEIQNHLNGVQDGLVEQLQRMMATGGAANGKDGGLAELAAVLRDFEQSILQVAGTVGASRETLTRLQLGELIGEDGNY